MPTTVPPVRSAPLARAAVLVALAVTLLSAPACGDSDDEPAIVPVTWKLRIGLPPLEQSQLVELERIDDIIVEVIYGIRPDVIEVRVFDGDGRYPNVLAVHNATRETIEVELFRDDPFPIVDGEVLANEVWFYRPQNVDFATNACFPCRSNPADS